jgi:feruloyl esterase
MNTVVGFSFQPIVGLGVLLSGLIAASSAVAALSNCTASAVAALGVPDMSIATVSDVPAAGANPEYCDVKGSVATRGHGVPAGSANFEVQLPANWNGKFLFWGVGGLAGSTYADFAANPVDLQLSLVKGYATTITDTGHQAGGTDGAWALVSPGVPDEAKLTDYYFRATHEVTVAAKNLVKNFFGATKIQRSYFDGCSNGGRQAMVEATRFPDDYDGIIAGAPFMDIRTIIAGAKIDKVQLRSPSSYIPASLLPMIDQAIYASCDAADGVQDGLIQNPAKCAFNPDSLICKNGSSANCLTPQQANTLKSYFSALRDQDGRLVYTGASVSDLHGAGMDLWTTGFVPPADFSANEPWGGTGFSPAPIAWQFVDHIMKFIVARDSTFDLRDFPVSQAGVVSNAALAFFDRRTEAGDGDEPGKLRHFIAKDKKLLVFHGFSDPALTALRTIKWYEDLVAITEGRYHELQENVRLFLVPGMQHCIGGPGPNFFDTLSALENWVEHGVAPNGILATHLRSDPIAQCPCASSLSRRSTRVRAISTVRRTGVAHTIAGCWRLGRTDAKPVSASARMTEIARTSKENSIGKEPC